MRSKGTIGAPLNLNAHTRALPTSRRNDDQRAAPGEGAHRMAATRRVLNISASVEQHGVHREDALDRQKTRTQAVNVCGDARHRDHTRREVRGFANAPEATAPN